MRQRVKERGESECRPVMGWIGVELEESNITPRESGQTSPWSHITRELEKPIQEAKQMTEAKATGAVSRELEGWCKKASPTERASAASAYREGNQQGAEKPRPAKGVSEA